MALGIGGQVARLFIGVEADASKARGELQSIGAEGGKTGGVLKGALGTALGFAGATIAMTGLSSAFGSVTDGVFGMNASLETSTLQFETLMGDSDRAREHVEGLFDFAAKTPFETGPIIEASRIMQTFGGDALNTTDNLTLFGDAAAATSQPINDIAFWMSRAYAAIQAGQPFGEATMRLMEMGVIGPQVRSEIEALTASGADSGEVWEALSGSMGRFSGGMEKQAATFDGVMSTFSDTISMFMANAGKPLFEAMKDLLSGFNEFASSPAFGAITEAIGEGLSRAVRGLIDLFSRVASVVGPVLNSIFEQVGPLASAAADMGRSFAQSVLPPLQRLGAAVGPIVSKVFGALGDIIGDLLPKVRPVVDAIGKLAGVIIDGLAQAFEVVMPLVEPVLGLFGDVAGVVLDLLAPAIDIVSGILGHLFDVLRPVADFLVSIFGPAFEHVGNAVSLFGDVVGGVVDLVTGAFNGLVGLIGDAISALLEPIRAVVDLASKVPGPWQEMVGSIRDGIDSVQDDLESWGETAEGTGSTVVQAAHDVDSAWSGTSASYGSYLQDMQDDTFAAGISVSGSWGEAADESVAAAGTIPPGVAGALDAGAGQVEAAAGRLANRLPKSLREASNAGERIAADTPADIAAAWRDGRDSWRSALDLFRDDVKASMRRSKEIAKLEALLAGEGAGEDLKKGLKSKDPIVRAQAQATIDLIKQRLADLRDSAYTFGKNTSDEYADGMSAGLARARSLVYDGLAAIRGQLKALSPPGPASPLHYIDRWAFNTGEEYAVQLGRGIGMAERTVGGALRRVRGLFEQGPMLPGLGTSALTAPQGALGATRSGVVSHEGHHVHEHRLDPATMALLSNLGLDPDRIERLLAEMLAASFAGSGYRMRQEVSTR